MLRYLAPVLLSAVSLTAVAVSASLACVQKRRARQQNPDADGHDTIDTFVEAVRGQAPHETVAERFEAADTPFEFADAVAHSTAQAAGALVRNSVELVNTLTHGAGLLGAAVVTGALVYGAVVAGSTAAVVGGAVFGTTMLLLYGASTAYHAVAEPARKRTFRLFDHLAILYLIAGTYTPFALVAIGGKAGAALLALVWSMALGGTVFKVIPKHRDPNNLTWFYVAMGWLAVFFARPLVAALWGLPLAWLVAGGVSYTAGVYYFLRDEGYDHAVWHLFVLGGTASHVAAVFTGALGRGGSGRLVEAAQHVVHETSAALAPGRLAA